MGASRNDVAIYLPATAGLYDRGRRRASGAERQMTLLARALSEGEHRVVQIVYPVADRIPLPNPRLTLVERPRHQIGDQPFIGAIREAVETWRALSLADARVVVVRKRSAALGVAALFCRLRRRRLIFSSANDYEFMHAFPDGRPRRVLYGLGLRLADAVVVQSEGQLMLARRAYPRLRRLVHIPSFAEDAPPSSPDQPERSAFLWIGRVVDYKQPLRYVELARAFPDARFLMIPVIDVSEPDDSPLLPAVRAAPRDIPNLRVLDPVTHAEALDLIASSVAVVNTSRFEGMPNVFLEAWARGVPVLTLEVDPDGVVERHGLGVAAKGSWERFLAGAREVWEDQAERDQLSSRTRAYVRDVHSYHVVGGRWKELIEEVAGPAQSRAD